MAINDDDFDTLVCFDSQVSNGYSPPNFDTPQGAIALASLSADNLLTNALIPISPTGGPFNDALSGATTAKGQIILSGSRSTGFPTITTNGGATFSDITSLGTGIWPVASFSQNAGVMYLAGIPGVYKSVNQGSTWSLLSSSPTALVRMRCSKNGSVVAAIGPQGFFSLSIDGGATWANTDFLALSGQPSAVAADFGMSPDGTTFVVMLNTSTATPIQNFVWTSSNGGTTWILRSKAFGINSPWIMCRRCS